VESDRALSSSRESLRGALSLEGSVSDAPRRTIKACQNRGGNGDFKRALQAQRKNQENGRDQSVYLGARGELDYSETSGYQSHQ
jgi:hypothetical protein